MQLDEVNSCMISSVGVLELKIQKENNMKKLLGVTLSMVMALSLCACGGAAGKRGEIVSSDQTVVEEAKEEVKEVKEAEKKEVKETVENTEETVAEEDEEKFEAGSNQNGEYKNSFLGIGCKFDENWVLYSDEQIRENNELTMSLMGDDYAETMGNALESGSTVVDMMATNINSTDSINLSIDNVKLQGAFVGLDAFANATAKLVEEPLAQMGIENLSTEVIDYTFAGKECKAISICGVYSVPIDETNSIDVNMYETVVLYKKGTYIASIGACSFFENHTDEYLAMFYEVK